MVVGGPSINGIYREIIFTRNLEVEASVNKIDLHFSDSRFQMIRKS